MSTPSTNYVKQRLILILLSLFFIGPMIGAWALWASQSYVPETLNNGHLIQNPPQIQTLKLQNANGKIFNSKQLRGQWSLLYVSPGTCQKLCQENLYKMRQVRKALGKNQNRLQRLILTFTPEQTKLNKLLQHEYLGTLHLVANKNDLNMFLKQLKSKNIALNQGALYIIDPLGNVIMSYQVRQSPKEILKDLKRLLSVSQIG